MIASLAVAAVMTLSGSSASPRGQSSAGVVAGDTLDCERLRSGQGSGYLAVCKESEHLFVFVISPL